jgi:hypothetical protein
VRSSSRGSSAGLHALHHAACVPLLTIACAPLLLLHAASEDYGPTRNLLTSQFLTPAEFKQMLQHCHTRGDRQGLMLAAMLALGVYNGFRSVDCSTGPQVCSPCSLGGLQLTSMNAAGQTTCPCAPMACWHAAPSVRSRVSSSCCTQPSGVANCRGE